MRGLVRRGAVLVDMGDARERAHEVVDGVEEARALHRDDESEQAHSGDQEREPARRPAPPAAVSPRRYRTMSGRRTHERSMK